MRNGFALSDAILTEIRDLAFSSDFYSRKLQNSNGQSFFNLPFTTKAELIEDQSIRPPYGTIFTTKPVAFTRIHQTSGTSSGQPLCWLDTPRNWEWLLRCWLISFPFMGLRPTDRVFFPFSFGPFLGFWTAFEAACRFGCLCLPGGGMTSTARLRFLLDHAITTVFVTPTYALHLAEIAARENLPLSASAVRLVVVAGEPGGSIPATRARIAEAWGARVIDHYGLTEVGPVAIEPEENPGRMLLLESEYIVEVLKPGTGQPADLGEPGELVLTNLGRWDSPLIRYRTGDLVKLADTRAPNGWRMIDGGIIGRIDDMLQIRGNNVYPSAIEAIVRCFPEIAEFRILVEHTGAMPVLMVEIESDSPTVAAALARSLQDRLLVRVEVRAAPPGTLPRYELKARRVIHKR